MSKLYDLTVKTGEYTNSNGDVKSRYENIGVVMQGGNGQYMMLKRTFNPAGVPNPDNKDNLIVSMFEPKEREQAPHNPAKQNAYQPQTDLDDEIGF